MAHREEFERKLNAASGWLALGNLIEANKELDSLAPEECILPEALELRCRIYANAERWPFTCWCLNWLDHSASSPRW